MRKEIKYLCRVDLHTSHGDTDNPKGRPRTNIYLERKQFYELKQGENENIDDFSARVRVKANGCGFDIVHKSDNCECDCKYRITDRKEDEIRSLVMCKKKDKVTQKGLWEMYNKAQDLEEI